MAKKWIHNLQRPPDHALMAISAKKTYLLTNLVFWNWAASENENEQMTTKFEKKENWDGALFCQEIIGRMGNWGKKNFLATLFLLKQKAGVMKESPLSLVSRTKNVFSWRKVHWVFFLERRTKFEWEKKKLNGLSWRTPSFCWRTTSFCWRRKQMEKGFCQFFSHSNFVLRSRKKTQWTFLQDTILLLQDNIILLQEKTTVKSFLPSLSIPILI